MKRLRLCLFPLACLAVLAACNASTSSSNDLSGSSMPDLVAVRDFATPADLTVEDLASPEDLTPPADLRRPPDMVAIGQCQQDADCRLFSSYCETAACQCFSLPKGTPDPVCQGKMVDCFADPCMNRKAACENHFCIVR